MKIYSVYEEEFRAYGAVRKEDFSGLLQTLSGTDCPEAGTVYVASYAAMEEDPAAPEIERELYGGMPIQIGPAPRGSSSSSTSRRRSPTRPMPGC